MRHNAFKPSSSQRELVLIGLRNLCRLYWGPDLNQCRDMVDGVFFKPFKELILLFSEKSSEALTTVDGMLESISTPAALLDTLQTLHVSLFVNNPEGLVTPLYHSCYLYDGAPMMGPPAQQMQQRLDVLGLSMTTYMNEPLDHLSIELECLFYMLDMGWSTDFKELLPEAALFAGTEIAEWLPTFRDRLGQVGSSEPYLAGATLTHDMVQLISRIET